MTSDFNFPPLCYRESTSHPRVKGFTLIEISIVMAIVALLLTVVGPFAISALSKSEARVEIQTVKRKLSNAGYFAYFNNQDLLLQFNNNKMRIVTAEGENLFNQRFDHITFPQQQIKVSNKGFTTTQTLTMKTARQQASLNLNKLINRQPEEQTADDAQ